MKVSHKHKYVFVELPMTASSAVGLELIENYDAENFKEKHALYREFFKQASPEEKEYFVFSTIRNPIDVVVSKYMKYVNNHHNYHIKKKKYMNGGIDKFISPIRERRRFNWVQKNKATFSQFLLKYYTKPYTNWSIMEHHNFDFVMRFENIQEDFNIALKKIGIQPKRDLPVRNKTEKKKAHESYFDSLEAIERGKYVFGPFMQKWNYEFPENWGENTVSKKAIADFNSINKVKKIYWKYLH